MDFDCDEHAFGHFIEPNLTVLGIGDGGLIMTLSDLDTAVRAGIPMLILVFNDRT